MPCKLLKSIGSFWLWICCINANLYCLSSVTHAFLFRQDLGKWRHIWQRGFRFSHSSNLPLRSKCCHICINHYQSLVPFLSFTKHKRKTLPAVISVLELIGAHFNFLRQNFHFLQKTSKPWPVRLKLRENLFAAPPHWMGSFLFCSPKSNTENVSMLHIPVLCAAHQNSAIHLAAFIGTKHLLYTEELMKFVQKCSWVTQVKLNLCVNKILSFFSSDGKDFKST